MKGATRRNIMQKANYLKTYFLTKTKSGNRRLYFPWGKEGEIWYVKKQSENRYIFSRTKEFENQLSVKLQLSKQGNSGFLFFSLGKIVPIDGYVSIFKIGNDYRIQPATEEEKGNAKKIRKTNTVICCANNKGVKIEKNIIKYLNKFPTVEITVHQTMPFYIRFHPTKKSNLPQIRKISWIEKEDSDQYSYQKKIKPQNGSYISIPQSFFHRTGIKDREPIFTWINKEGDLIVEARNPICPICKKTISQYSDEKHVCQNTPSDIYEWLFHTVLPKLDSMVYQLTGQVVSSEVTYTDASIEENILERLTILKNTPKII